jgi:ketosteroid isomerase-like protein
MRTAILGLGLLALGACRSASPAPDVVTPMDASARVTPEQRATGEVLAVLRSQSAAWNRGDVEGFMEAGYWRSPELTFYSQGSITKGYDATLARYKQRYTGTGAEMGQLEFFQVETQALAEDVQLARGHWKLAFGGKPAVAGLFSLVLRRLPEGWRIVHDHTSVDAESK